MDNGLRINEFLTVTGQIQPEQLKQAAEEGFKSVLNLRSPDELGFLANEQQLAEALNLHYINLPLKVEQLDELLITKTIKKLEQLPKPVLVHCAAGMRSTAVALLSIAIQEGLTPEQTLAKARSLGFRYVDCTLFHTQFKQRFVEYINQHTKVAATAA